MSLRVSRRGCLPVVMKIAGWLSLRLARNRCNQPRQPGEINTVRGLLPLPMISTSPERPSAASRFSDNASEMRIPVESSTSSKTRRRRPVKWCADTTDRTRLTSSSVRDSTRRWGRRGSRISPGSITVSFRTLWQNLRNNFKNTSTLYWRAMLNGRSTMARRNSRMSMTDRLSTSKAPKAGRIQERKQSLILVCVSAAYIRSTRA
jgi:hypothetical protein